MADIHWVDALYQVYVTGLIAVVAVVVISGATGDGKLRGHQLVEVRVNGAAVVGTLAALAVLFASGRAAVVDRSRWSLVAGNVATHGSTRHRPAVDAIFLVGAALGYAMVLTKVWSRQAVDEPVASVPSC